MRPSEIGTASLLQAMMRLTLLLRPVLSSDSNLRYGSGIQIQMLLNKPKESSNAGNTENPAYNPKRFLCNTQIQDINLKNIYTYKPNTFFCETCGNTDADGCILTRLGKDICHSILSNEHNKASECFSEYSEALKNHKKMPPNFPGDYIKICWEPFLRFIEILTADKDNRNALIDVLQKYRDLPPFLLKNIVIADAGFLVHEGVTKSNEKKHEKKLGGCNLREISLLYKRYALHDCQGDKSMQEVEAYNDILATILFYSPSLQKLTNLKKKLHIDYNIGREKETSKIVDFKQFLTKKFISASVLEYLDPSSYEDDEFIFEAFRRAAQEVIDKECTITSAWYLLRWCEFFYWHKTIEKALNQNFQITFERLAKYVKNIDYKREKEDDKRIKEKSEREEKKWKRNEEKKERREEIDINEDKHMMNKNHPWRHPDLEILMRETNSIFPFKLENIIVSCSDFSKAEGPLFEKVRDSNRGNTGHKKISECSLLEFKFLCQLYELDEPKGKTREQGYHYWLTVKPIIKKLFWHNVRQGNIAPSKTDNFLDSFVFSKIRGDLANWEILILLERDLISFTEFFRALEVQGDFHSIVEPLTKEFYGVMNEGKEFRHWKELAKCKSKPEFFKQVSGCFFELTNIVKLLEVCSKYKDVNDLLLETLFEMQRVFYFQPKNIHIDEGDFQRKQFQKENPSIKSTSNKILITKCEIGKIIDIFNAYKSDTNEKVNKLLAYILLCAVEIKTYLGINLRLKVPEDFFAHVSLLPPERLKELVKARIVPARFLTNPPK